MCVKEGGTESWYDIRNHLAQSRVTCVLGDHGVPQKNLKNLPKIETTTKPWFRSPKHPKKRLSFEDFSLERKCVIKIKALTQSSKFKALAKKCHALSKIEVWH